MLIYPMNVVCNNEMSCAHSGIGGEALSSPTPRGTDDGPQAFSADLMQFVVNASVGEE